jgi:negative regulator of genetic competence, sporulation and motility
MEGPSRPQDEVLHIYGQEAWHDDVYIVANYNTLIQLIDLLRNAVVQGNGEGSFYANDGEGYKVIVIKATDEQVSVLEPVYSAEETETENTGKGLLPWNIIKKNN